MKDNNVVAFYCNNCHETVLNCEHNFEQLHEKGLCAKCLKNQNKTKDKWQKLKEWLEQDIKNKSDTDYQFILDEVEGERLVLEKMQELEKENE